MAYAHSNFAHHHTEVTEPCIHCFYIRQSDLFERHFLTALQQYLDFIVEMLTRGPGVDRKPLVDCLLPLCCKRQTGFWSCSNYSRSSFDSQWHNRAWLGSRNSYLWPLCLFLDRAFETTVFWKASNRSWHGCTDTIFSTFSDLAFSLCFWSKVAEAGSFHSFVNSW
jgi:hypothetical protein